MIPGTALYEEQPEMTSPDPIPTERPMAPAKLRILETSDRLFTEDGIRSVGIDRLIAESQVTKATFYKHYGSKDRLIVDCMSYRHRRTEELYTDRSEAIDVVRGFVADALADMETPGFRGDAFLNAAAEFPGEAHPVRAIVFQHREWLSELLADALRDLGHPLSGDAADDLVVVRDGALSGAYAGDPVAARAALTRALDRVLAQTR